MKRLLLDVCCGPCSTHVIEVLKNDYELVLYFGNSNIFPYEEYKKRLESSQNYAKHIGIPFILGKYDHEKWLNFIQEKIQEPHKHKEGGLRCEACYEFRLYEAARIALENKFDMLATTLTISPYKDAKTINSIAKNIAKKYEIDFYEGNFKKKDGFLKSVKLSKQACLYRQDYCGCEFSISKD